VKATQRPVLSLTDKQKEFVRLVTVEGYTKASAYRASYNTRASARGVSGQVTRLLRAPAVKEAIERVRAGDWSTELLIGVKPSVLLMKKMLALAQDETVPSYVRVRALEAGMKYRSEVMPEKSAPGARTREAEIRRILRQAVVDAPALPDAPAENDFTFDEFLDAPPAPSPSGKAERPTRFRSARESANRGHLKSNR
jgi:hypothetical protein